MNLVRIASFIGILKRRILMNIFFNSQFSYCLLICVCHCRTNISKIKRIHGRCFRFIYNDKQSLFSELLEMDGSALVQINKIQSLAIEMFCDSKNLSPPIMNNIFTQKDNGRDKLREISKFSRPLVKSVYCGSESVSFLGTKISDMLQDGCRDFDNLNTCENKVKKRKPENCSCRLYKICINNVGFVKKEKNSLEYSSGIFGIVGVG